MSIAYDTSSQNSGTGFGTSLSFTTSGSNRILHVLVYEATAAVNTTAVKYNNVSMTKIDQQVNTDRAISLWELVNPTIGTNTVTLTGTGSYTIFILGISHTGANQSGQPNAHNTGHTASGTSLSVAITSTIDNTWLVGGFVSNAGTVAAGANTTLRVLTNSNLLTVADSNADQTPPGSFSLAVTSGSGEIGGLVLAITPASIAQTLSESLAMASLDTLTQSFGFIQTVTDSLAMASLDTIRSIYGWVNTAKSTIGSWVNNKKS